MRPSRVVILTTAICVSLSLPAADAGAQLAPPTGDTASGCSAPGFDDRCEKWATTYHDPELAPDSSQFPAGIALSSDGSRLFEAVTNQTGSGFDARSRWTVLGRDPGDGRILWESKFGDPNRYSFPRTIAANERMVFVSGSTRSTFSDPDGLLVTIAFDAATGQEVWRATNDGPGGTDNAKNIAMSPDGRIVIVSSVSAGQGGNSDLDYVLLGYNADTGERLFVTRYTGIGEGRSDSPFGLAVSPTGDMAYVTGWSAAPGEYNVDYGTIAVAITGPTAGEIVWEARYDGTGVGAPDQANAIAVDPSGERVYVTGMSNEADASSPFSVNYVYATLAYDARTGEQVWEARRGFPGTNFNHPNALAADSMGRVFVTGQSKLKDPSDNDIATVAYDGMTGSELWADRYGVPEHDLELTKGIAVDPGGDGVYVTGISSSKQTRPLFAGQAQRGDHITIGYDPRTGSRDFTARYNATGYDYDVGHDALVAPDGRTLFLSSALTHNIETDRNFYDSGVVAYEIAGSPGQGEVRKKDSSLSLTVTSATGGRTLEAVLTDAADGSALAGRSISFYAGDKLLGSAPTDENGRAGWFHETKDQGQRPYEARFEGDDSYHASSARTNAPKEGKGRP